MLSKVTSVYMYTQKQIACEMCTKNVRNIFIIEIKLFSKDELKC